MSNAVAKLEGGASSSVCALRKHLCLVWHFGQSNNFYSHVYLSIFQLSVFFGNPHAFVWECLGTILIHYICFIIACFNNLCCLC